MIYSYNYIGGGRLSSFSKNTFYLLIILVFASCADKEGPFEIKVVSTDNVPIEGACIRGGIDWNYFNVQTDQDGMAILPGHARGENATIFKTNFLPEIVEYLAPAVYTLEPTSKSLRLIGEVEGGAIRFCSDTLTTITYQGNYHLYTFNDNGVTELASAQLPSCVKKFELFGDTLWFSTHDDGIYVYSLENSFNPQQICHLSITGYLKPFAIKDSIITICGSSGPGLLRIFSFTFDGQFQELASIGNFNVKDMIFISHYLILVGGEESLPTIFDLQDPEHPQLVYNGLEWAYQSGIILGTSLVLVPTSGNAMGYVTYKLLDLSNPPSPHEEGTFVADAWLSDIINENTAVGRYYFDYTESIAILKGSITNSFSTVAIVSEGELWEGFGGSMPPYYIIGNNLWKLED
jgi:hypothetical protein